MSSDPFVIYRASAGAGKTHALVREYLVMALLQGPDRLAQSFRSILAITFTNKAAAEMKDRIMDSLAQMAAAPAPEDEPCMASDVLLALRQAGRNVSPESLQAMARTLYSAILHRYSDLSVSTIDSFMHRIVRTFAHDLGQPMNFDVMIDQQKIIDSAVAQLMSLAGTEGQEQLTQVLQAFAESRMEDGKGYNIENTIAALAHQLFKEDIADHLQQLAPLQLADFQQIHRSCTAAMRDYRERLQESAASLLSTLASIGIDDTSAAYGQKGYYGYLSKLASGTVAELSARTVAAFEEGKMLSSKCHPSLQQAVDRNRPLLDQAYNSLKQLLTDGLNRYNTLRALLRNLYSTALLHLLDQQVRLYSLDNDLVHIADFNRLINKVVQDEDNPAPFIYERLGNRYRHFLIDEFQDTSRMQWHNMVPLLENGISQGYKSIVVGDSKQFIYRFRQGDVTQFLRLPFVDGMRHHGRTLSLPGVAHIASLAHNRRSAQAIIDFNNSLFSWLARHVYTDNPLVQDVYIGRDADGNLLPEGHESLRQLKYMPLRGHVEVNFVAKADAQEAGSPSVRHAIFDAIVQTIHLLTSKRGYNYSDIAILARNNAELAALGSHIAQHSDIPQTSTESFYLSESHAVMAIVAALRLLHNSADRAAAADLHYRLCALGLHHTPLDQLFLSSPSPLPTPLATHLHHLASLDLYDRCEEIIRLLHLQGLDPLHTASLLDRVASFAARHRQDTGQFLQWFDEQHNLSAASPENIDAVQLLTIHKAKGLGKPVVICPLSNGTDHAPDLWVDVPPALLPPDCPQLPTAFVSLPAKDTTLFEPQRRHEQLLSEVDELNILYVAFTRAKQQLYIFSPDPSDTKRPNPDGRRFPALLHRFVHEVPFDPGDPQCNKPQPPASPAATDTPSTSTPPVYRQLSNLPSLDWTSRVAIASPSAQALTPLQESKIRFGTYAHDLLATIVHAADTDSAVARFAATHTLLPDELQRLSLLAHRVVSHPLTSRFFDPAYSVKNECDLAHRGSHARPDRIVITPAETWVVDFKTGHHTEDNETQVAAYCRAVAHMGYPAVSGWLLYLQPDIELRPVATSIQ